jgi:aspartate aminotransferase
MKPLSSRLSASEPSATQAVADRARQLRAAGKDIITLATGDPDFPTPAHIVDAAVAAMEAGDTHYPPARGRADLIEAIVAKLALENGVTATPGQIVVTPGAKWALFIALAALLDQGDEVLVLDPAWVSYAPMITLNGGRPIRLDLPAEEGYRFTADQLRTDITPRTKAILVNSPNNPTGRVLSGEELGAIASVAIEHDLWVISDEIYEHLVFDDRRHMSPATWPEMAERTIIINGFSKAYAMTGWRLGWMCAPAPVAALAMNLHSQGVTSAASFAMAAGVAALNGPQECVADMVAAYDERRRFMVTALNEMPGVHCPEPEGAFYLFPRFTGSSRSSVEIAEELLEQAGIATVPGVAFGSSGEHHLRLTIATSMDDLERAVERLARVAGDL